MIRHARWESFEANPNKTDFTTFLLLVFFVQRLFIMRWRCAFEHRSYHIENEDVDVALAMATSEWQSSPRLKLFKTSYKRLWLDFAEPSSSDRHIKWHSTCVNNKKWARPLLSIQKGGEAEKGGWGRGTEKPRKKVWKCFNELSIERKLVSVTAP